MSGDLESEHLCYTPITGVELSIVQSHLCQDDSGPRRWNEERIPIRDSRTVGAGGRCQDAPQQGRNCEQGTGACSSDGSYPRRLRWRDEGRLRGDRADGEVIAVAEMFTAQQEPALVKGLAWRAQSG